MLLLLGFKVRNIWEKSFSRYVYVQWSAPAPNPDSLHWPVQAFHVNPGLSFN